MAMVQGPSGPGQQSPSGQGQDPWKPDEKPLREREVLYTGRGVWAQGVVGACAVVATLLAAVVAYAAVRAVETTADGIERQAIEARLSTAIEAIGEDQPAERVAGFTLLRRHVTDRLSAAIDGGGEEERREAYGVYNVALDVLENYLKNPPNRPIDSGEAAAEAEPGGLGYGEPDVPPDNEYAANELRAMMNLKADVELLGMEPNSPSVDLSNVQLDGKSWAGVDFAWLGGGHNFPGIDLRGANLERSIWGTTPDSPPLLLRLWPGVTPAPDVPKKGSNLAGAHLQCANLGYAKLIGTTLKGADLRGADLSGADFTDADLREIRLDGATWSDATKGLDGFNQKGDVSRGRPDIDTCLAHYSEQSAN
jgi:Pentapeptide repeats (8 copies)